jgi:hypothetical protein
MDGKVVSAFVAGAVVASGIVYMSVRPSPVAKPAKVAQVIPQPVIAAPQVPVAVESPAQTAPRPVIEAPVREKPSPMPPPVRRERPVIVARDQEPPAPPVQQPVQQPTPETRAADPVPANPPPAPEPEQPAAAAPILAAPAPSAPESRAPHTVTLEAGTMLPVRIGETVSSARNQLGDSFLATLDQALVLDGFIIAERGSRAEGRVVELEPAGRTRGTSHLGIELVRLSTSDGQRIRIRTEPFRKDGASSTGSDAAKIGAGAAIGAAIGAIAGGGKGAAIGAGVGGAAGVGDVLLTRGKPAEIPVETRLTFRVQEAVTITEKLD